MKGKKKPANPTDAGVPEVDLARGELRIHLKRPIANSNPVPPRSFSPDIVVAGPPADTAESAATMPREDAAETGRAEDSHIVKSPVVGTFSAPPGRSNRFSRPRRQDDVS